MYPGNLHVKGVKKAAPVQNISPYLCYPYGDRHIIMMRLKTIITRVSVWLFGWSVVVTESKAVQRPPPILNRQWENILSEWGGNGRDHILEGTEERHWWERRGRDSQQNTTRQVWTCSWATLEIENRTRKGSVGLSDMKSSMNTHDSKILI